MLNLHEAYKVPGMLNRKFDIQRAGPFKVAEKVGNNAYRLELPANKRIHPVVNVSQLEPLPQGKDLFGRRVLPREGDLIEDDSPHSVNQVTTTS